MERTILIEPQVLRLLHDNFIEITLYTDKDHEPWYSNRTDIKDPMTGQGTNPLYVVLAPDGETVLRMIGFTRSTREFMHFLRSAEEYF